MKVFKETDRIIYYMNRDHEEMLAFKFGTKDLDRQDCDSCGKEQDVVYISPFLVDKHYCKECTKSPLYNMKFEIAKSQQVYNDLIILAKKLKMTDLEYNLINRFFDIHSSRKINIYNFIQKGD